MPSPQRDSPGERLWRVGLTLVFMLLGCLATRQVSSLDVGFHLKAGSWILDGHGWPRTDPFTFTVGDHAYVDTSWGYQVMLALLERAFGGPGLVLFHAALVIALWWLVYRAATLTSLDPRGVVLLVALGAVACEMRYEARPEVLSYTLLAVVSYVMNRHARGLSSRLWLMPPVFLVWANTHSLFVLGWIVLACFCCGQWLRRGRPDSRLIGWSVVSAAVTLVNPYGWRAMAFPFTLLSRFQEENPFNQTIGEFVSPFDLGLSAQFPFFPRLPIYCFRVFFVLAAISLVMLVRHRRWSSALLTLPFGWLAFGMVRNIPLLVIACLPGVAWSLAGPGGLLHAASRARGRVLSVATAAAGAAALLLALFVYHDAYYISSRRQDRFGLGWNRLTLPVDAVEHAVASGLEGRVLNHLNFGGYLMWARDRPVFIDGRLEVIGEEFYAEYRRVLASAARLEAVVAFHDIEWVVFPHRVSGSLLRTLERDPRWTRAYVDPLAAVYVRSDRIEADQLHPSAALPPVAAVETSALPGLGGAPRRGNVSRRLAGLVRRERFPSEPFNLGLYHYFRGDPARAAPLFAEAVRASDGAYYETYLNLGSALYRMDRLSEARACYRVALDDAPSNRLARDRVEEIDLRLSAFDR